MKGQVYYKKYINGKKKHFTVLEHLAKDVQENADKKCTKRKHVRR